jgi:hypothetical protein
MARITIEIDDTILAELRALQRREARPLGAVASQLLAEALGERAARRPAGPTAWISRPMSARIDLDDKVTLAQLLDESPLRNSGIVIERVGDTSGDRGS